MTFLVDIDKQSTTLWLEGVYSKMDWFILPYSAFDKHKVAKQS